MVGQMATADRIAEVALRLFTDHGYAGVAEAQMEGIGSALGLEDGVCDWEQLFAVFPEPWFVEGAAVAAPKLTALGGSGNRLAS